METTSSIYGNEYWAEICIQSQNRTVIVNTVVQRMETCFMVIHSKLYTSLQEHRFQQNTRKRYWKGMDSETSTNGMNKCNEKWISPCRTVNSSHPLISAMNYLYIKVHLAFLPTVWNYELKHFPFHCIPKYVPQQKYIIFHSSVFITKGW